jgi:DNA-binding MarR family transcriptional regulator
MQRIEGYISYLLVQVSKAHRYQAETALNEIGLHTGQELILFQLWDKDGLAQSELAICMGVEAPTVTKMLQRMESAGLVERRQDAEDARVSRVYLTEQGRSLEEPTLQAWQQLEERTIAELTDVELMVLRSLLLKMRGNLVRCSDK